MLAIDPPAEAPALRTVVDQPQIAHRPAGLQFVPQSAPEDIECGIGAEQLPQRPPGRLSRGLPRAARLLLHLAQRRKAKWVVHFPEPARPPLRETTEAPPPPLPRLPPGALYCY